MFLLKHFPLVVRNTERRCKCMFSPNYFKMSSVGLSNEIGVCEAEKKASSEHGSDKVSHGETNGTCEQKSDTSCDQKRETSCDQKRDVDQMIRIDKTPYTIVTEGKAEVLFPSTHDVFYNPVQEFNRDLSIAVMKQFVKMIPLMDGLYDRKFKRNTTTEGNSSEEIHVLEALAASGLRSVRYAKEVPGLTKVVANDMNSQAYESIQRNIKYNNVGELVMPSNVEATLLMYQHRNPRKRFEVIDLDPYGTAAPFLDAAVQSVCEGGLLMVTCTDMAVLCGNSPETCHAKYGAVSVKGSYCHEMALRILLQSIETHANRYGRYIEPILSVSADFYARIFVRIYTGAIFVKKSFCKLGMVYDCMGCGAFHVQPLGKHVETQNGQKYVSCPGPPVDSSCKICGERYKIGGPIWIAGMHNKDFIRQIVSQVEEEKDQYKTSRRILGVLNVILEELDDCPLFYRVDRLCGTVHVKTLSALQYRSAILNAGYRVSISHALPVSLKTDAPPEVVWDVIRTWAKLHPGKKSFELEPSKTILNKESSTEVSFELHPDANPESRAKSLLRFQLNPQPFWGPKCRATTSLWADKTDEKRKNCQAKRKRQKKYKERDLKQFPCKKFKQNECDKGDECRYSHEITQET